MDIPVPPIVEAIAEVVQIIPQEHFQQRTVEQIVDARVPQAVKEQLFAEETIQTSVEIRRQDEYVVPTPAASFVALDPAVLDGFQQLVSIGASALNTLMKQQLDDLMKVILRYSKKFQILPENAQKPYDLSKAKLGDLLREQQAFARSHKAGRRRSVDSVRDGTGSTPMTSPYSRPMSR